MDHQKLNNRLERISASIWQKITRIDEYKGHWIGGVNLAPQVLDRLQRSVLVTSTGASTRIEGAKLSDEDIERFMRGISIQQFSSRDKQEVQGYFELLENIFSSWEGLTFSESLIKHLHKELLKFVEKDSRHRGEYKKQENKVLMVNEVGESIGVLFDTTPAYLTPKEMLELIEWTNYALEDEAYHPLLIIGNFLVQFLQIHPFQDGNGRLSRILTNYLLLKTGYLYTPYISHEKIIEDNKPEYYLALRQSQKTFGSGNESIEPWLDFFMMVNLLQAEMAISLLSEETIEPLLSPQQLKVWRYLQGVDEATPKELSEELAIPRPTINQVVRRLMEMEQIIRIGTGRTTRYKVIRKK